MFSKDYNQPINISNVTLLFNPKTVDLTDCRAQIGNSDFNMKGQLSNFFEYIFTEGTLKGNVSNTSQKIDINQFMTDNTGNASNASTTNSESVFLVPDKIDFIADLTASKLLYDEYDLNDVAGKVHIFDQKITFDNVAFKTMKGEFAINNGEYNTQNPIKPKFAANINVKDIDIVEAFAKFNTIQKLAPIIEYAKGLFSLNVNFASDLNKDMMPNYATITSIGNATLTNTSFSGVPVLDKIAQVTKLNQMSSVSLSDLDVPFEVKEGKLFLKKPITIPFTQDTKLVLNDGYSSIDKQIDYNGQIQIPKSKVGVSNTAINQLLAKSPIKTTINESDVINLGLTIGGTVTKPNVKVNFKDIASQAGDIKDAIVNNVKDQVQQQVSDVKEQVKDKVNEQVDNAKAEAEAKAKELQAQAQAEAEKQKQALQDKINETKKQQEDSIKKKLGDKVKNLFGGGK